MNSCNVTFACDDGTTLKHTKVFQNRNLFQCYHNNRGYCSFRDKCRYQHFQDICTNNICREKECKKRHPVICRYKNDCKFLKTNNCAFKHIHVDDKDLEKEYKICTDDIKRLKSEITDLKNDINSKEIQLSESRREIQQLNLKLAVKLNNQQEIDLENENINLKKQIEDLENENEALKIKLKENDKSNDKSGIQHQDKENTNIKVVYTCEKCCLQFSSKESLKKHNNNMHKAKLTF